MRRALCLSLVLGLLAGPLYAAAPSAEDAEVRKGVQQVNTGKYDAGIVTLDAAARRLAASKDNPQELSRPTSTWASPTWPRGRDVVAEANFRQSLAQSEAHQLPPDKFAQRVIEVFEKARAPRPATPGALLAADHSGEALRLRHDVRGGRGRGAGHGRGRGPLRQRRGQHLRPDLPEPVHRAGVRPQPLLFDIPVRGSGTLSVTVDWQGAAHALDVSLVPLSCSDARGAPSASCLAAAPPAAAASRSRCWPRSRPGPTAWR